MKKLILVAFFFVFALDAAVVIGQKRPVRTGTAKPTPQTAATPLPKADAGAQGFFNAGLKCPKEDYDCQISNYTKAINLELNTKAVFKNRGLAYMGKEEYGKAIADLSKAIELDKNDAGGYKDRGKAYYMAAQNNQVLDMAIRDFSSAIELEPKDAEAYKLRATAYFTRARFDDAKADLEKSLSLNPKDAEINQMLADVKAESAKSPAGAPNKPQSSDDKLAEFEAWSKTKNSTKAADYWEFLQTFPNGAFAKQAYDKMIEIGDPEWHAARDSKDPYVLRDYVNKNPNGPFTVLARAAQKAATDAMVEWESVDIKDAKAVAAFLAKYPNSKYVDEAAESEWKAMDKTDWAKLTAFRNKYPGSKHIDEIKALIDAARQQGLANVKPGTVIPTASGIEMVYVPGGTFMMGSNNGDSDEKPVRSITISEGFWMGRYEITQGQWQSVMGSNPSNFKQCGDNCPVETVSWNDAKEFIAKLNAANDGFVYSLPSEAQWEYTARAGTTGNYGGTGNLDEMGWYDKNSGGKTHPVGEKKPNAFGLYDMHGNVWEWCEDWYGSYPNGSVTDPTGASSGQYRVLRGGSWGGSAANARSAYRGVNSPDNRGNFVGFRVVASVR